MKYGELIYSGVLRTSVSSLLKRVEIGGEEYRLSSEYLATTADAYLVLEYVRNDAYTCEKLDNYSHSTRAYREVKTEKEDKSRINAMRRLARVVCSDLEEIGEESAVSIAEQVKEAQVEELIDSVKRIKEMHGLKTVISAGIGDFFVKEAVDSLDIALLPISSVYGREISSAFPAYAVAKLLEKQ